MLINQRQQYLLGLVLVSTLSANIQSVSALTVEPVNANPPEVTSTAFNRDGKTPLMLTSDYNQNFQNKNTSNTTANKGLNPLTSKRSGTLVSTSYNTVSMLRAMEDLQNIRSLGMNNVAEPISDAFTRELKVTTRIALVQDKSCANPVDLKQLPICQDKNVGKTAAKAVIHE
ncbi:hypothetical protein IQ259_04895 [Fortiea sp. LEGE XX443]|uniref:hypothetical protein n=1 Tax=Fortiea sp. LEGE XX443 TaxID=1828611 RepID=UPI0018802269|nr:hypothetical protein [Fortiea sp. LEGE XX443]MBE9004383.1 hypothetical protein [Fortiea sp. LEGE XX443]